LNKSPETVPTTEPIAPAKDMNQDHILMELRTKVLQSMKLKTSPVNPPAVPTQSVPEIQLSYQSLPETSSLVLPLQSTPEHAVKANETVVSSETSVAMPPTPASVTIINKRTLQEAPDVMMKKQFRNVTPSTSAMSVQAFLNDL
jgi:hypothetical protein